MQNVENKEFIYPAEDRDGYVGGLKKLFSLTHKQMEKIWLRTCVLLEEEYDNDDKAVIAAFLRSQWGNYIAGELAANLSCKATATSILELLEEMDWHLFEYPFDSFANEMNR